MFFTFRIGAGLGLCKARNDAAAEDAKSKGGGSLVRNIRRGLDARSRMKSLKAVRLITSKRPKAC